MKEMLHALVQHLRSVSHRIVRDVVITDPNGGYDPTYGFPELARVEVVDFDALLSEIDDFATTFEEK